MEEMPVGEEVAAPRRRAPGAGRKIQKRMPVIWEDGSISRPGARGSKAVQPPPARGPVTSALPLSRAHDGLANVAVAGVEQFWEKFHQYPRLQADLEKLYLWFEDFEQSLKRDNQELARILSGVQSLYLSPDAASAGKTPGTRAEDLAHEQGEADAIETHRVAGDEQFWEKFHQYHRLQAEAEKLYLWFEDFEQSLKHDNQEFDRLRAGMQTVYFALAQRDGTTVARRVAIAEPQGEPPGARRPSRRRRPAVPEPQGEEAESQVTTAKSR